MADGVCESCGSHQLEAATVEGVEVLACGLCGEVHGDGAVVERLAMRDAADERGVDPLIFPLVQALECVPTFRVSQASPGRARSSEYPFLFLRIAPEGMPHLERLLTSLEMANRETTRRWVIECSLQRGLLFILRPRFWKAIVEINEDDVREARADLPLLAKVIARDVQLAWWR